MESLFKQESIHRLITKYTDMKLAAELTIEQYGGDEFDTYLDPYKDTITDCVLSMGRLNIMLRKAIDHERN